jgi:hypothetical protein
MYLDQGTPLDRRRSSAMVCSLEPFVFSRKIVLS